MDQSYYKNYGHHPVPPPPSHHPHAHHGHHHHHTQQQQQHHVAAPLHHGHKAVSGREEFGGLDNDALDFSQLEDFITDDNDGNGSYFADTLANSEASKHAGGAHPPSQALRDRMLVIASGANDAGNFASVKPLPPAGPQGPQYPPSALPHNLPDSPPDSGSEPPYSPTEHGSRSPHQKANGLGNSRNLHDLLVHHPMYPQGHPAAVAVSAGAVSDPSLMPIVSHDMPSLGSPLPHMASMHVASLVPISPSAVNSSAGSPSGTTLTTLGVPQPPQTSALSTSGNGGQPVATSQHSDGMPSYYTPLQPVNGDSVRGRKRKSSESNMTNGANKHCMLHVKQEPVLVQGSAELVPSDSDSNNGSTSNNNGNMDDEFGFDFSGDPSMFMDSNYQCIKFQPFQENNWHLVADEAFKELPMPYYKVDADKGFNFSNADDAFVCQKKNHFQITCHARQQGNPKYVKTPDGFKLIDNFYVHFYGVKVESPNQTIKIEQSQSDRSKKSFHPVMVDLSGDQVAKITVGRLHFNETTSNNMRKKGKPNPDQRYFYLVVGLHAHCGDAVYPIISQNSQRIIVRASNPGQFESDMELSWQKGNTSDSIYHAGRVGINTDRPEEALVVYGNCKITGQITQPSDMRAKQDIQEVNTKEQLKNIQQLRVVRYKYNPEFAKMVGLSENEAIDTGVLAQEVQKVLPDAVRETGDIELPSGKKIENFLVVNKDRIFMENVGAVKELCKVTDKLETRIDQLEKITRLKRSNSGKSNSTNSGSQRGKKHSNSLTSLASSKLLCSSRSIQLLIFALVFIMTVCLIAMASLCVLEYQKRSSYEYHHGRNATHVILHSSPGGILHAEIPGVTHDHPTFHLVTNAPFHSQPTKYPKFPAKQFPRDKAQGQHGTSTKPEVLGRPSHCPNTRYLYSFSPCKVYCCAPGDDGYGGDYRYSERRNDVFTAEQRNYIQTPSVPPTPNTTVDVAASATSASDHKNMIDEKERRRRKRRQIHDHPKLFNVPSIRIEAAHINQTLSPSYCLSHSEGYHDCVSTENRFFASANLTYHVPISRYWNELYVSLVFNFSSQYNISRPQICQRHTPHPDCLADVNVALENKVDVPLVSGSSTVEFESRNVYVAKILVGNTPAAKYSIRFSADPDDSESLCLLKKETSKFFEFNFNFNRVCDE